jgi:hypothetical protein
MNLLHSLRHGQRFATSLVLVLAVLGVLTGVSLGRLARLGDDLERLDQVNLPATRMVHDLALLADEARGLEALLLLLDDERERRDVEARLMQQRGRIAERLASQVARLHDASDRQLLAEVNGALGAWWTVQDQVLSAARAARSDAAAAAQARRLLAGDSQNAYRRLLDTLERWWRHHDDLAQWSVKKARADLAMRLQPMLGGLLFLVLAAMGMALAARRTAAPRQDAGGAQAAPPQLLGQAPADAAASAIARAASGAGGGVAAVPAAAPVSAPASSSQTRTATENERWSG